MAGFPDDDGFDWEAAVAEIDRACQQAGQRPNESSSAAPDHGRSSRMSLSQNPQTKANGQQTLDGFFRPQRDGQQMRNATDVQPISDCEEQDLYIDPAAATSWIYPANVSRREYQFDITKTALFANTIVSLPTGLGKTLIAAVVMYNYFRWFPQGRIVFTAPSRPLVIQQIEACHNIMGIPQVMTIDMTGQMNPSVRAEHWMSRRVFFVTPQVLEKDIQSGTCPKQQIVCLVVDEAHRACGNYSYCVVVRELMAADVRLRILALTATPGSNQATIQAVVDNLQISCLEYRSDDDPDVRQYTHDRKLELIQVVMDKEIYQIRDRFLEVLQPVVNKLASLQVFYSRDYARITPFEFLTARERFRQAPPPALNSSRYREVEANFGAAITLYHIFKLLFSHGIRPALEMLQQKMEQPGPFLRMMGKNEKLLKIKQLMQQSVHHGAPSPKLEKLEQILLDHFSVHDPGGTRVIIFTNFRESVKDIMASLTRMQGTVKAMEFVGQSGKSSKGQTQKMQLAVLQKFRAGGFNTLVATCIAEEGLDIMEVDLVVCFDANVSPLRMIQRMGRTGRKRDGRVVVLASEGTELQGYLAKQAKSKALGKHMHNGGVQSFNFHPSPRMIPHRFKPEVQLVEIAIEQFVHRGHRQKVDVGIEDPGAAELTAEESAVLLKYTSSSNPWIPSLTAFRRFQLIPTPVYQVKHSFRTTSMLIDTLQSLQGAVEQDFSMASHPIDEVADSQPDEDSQGWSGFMAKDELHTLPPDTDEDTMDISADWLPIEPFTVSPGVRDEVVNGCLDQGDAGLECHRERTLVCEVCVTDDNEIEEKDLSFSRLVHQGQNDTGIRDNAHAEALTDLATMEDVNSQPETRTTSVEDSTAGKPRFHRCLFSAGVVSVSLTGQVLIAPPPTLKAREAHFTNGLTPVSSDLDGECCPVLHKEFSAKESCYFPPSCPSKCSPNQSLVQERGDSLHSGERGCSTVQTVTSPLLRSIGNSFTRLQVHVHQQTSTPTTAEMQIVQIQSEESFDEDDCQVIVPSSVRKTNRVVEAELTKTQAVYDCKTGKEEGMDISASQIPSRRLPPSNDHGVVSREVAMGPPLTGAGSFEGRRFNSGSQHLMQQHSLSTLLSPRLQGFPEDFSPRLSSLAQRGMVPVSPTVEMQNNVSPPLGGNMETPPQLMLRSQGLPPQGITLEKATLAGGAHVTGQLIAKTGDLTLKSRVRAQPVEGFISPIQPRTLEFPLADQGCLSATAASVRFRKSPLSSGAEVHGAGGASPCVKQVSGGSLDWQVCAAVPATIEKPRKFKRLRKVRDVGSRAENGIPSLRETRADDGRTDMVPASRGQKRCRRQIVAQPFVDEEAEVSSSEECSSDELEEDGGEDLEDFIDDGSNPSLETQNPPIGSADMMAVYRRSLLTPSPAQALAAPWMRLAKPHATPSTDGTCASSSLQTGNSSTTDKTSPAGYAEEHQPVGPVIETPTFHAISMAKIPTSFEARASCLKACDDLPAAGDEESKVGRLELRKRKLSFQANGLDTVQDLHHQETEEASIRPSGADVLKQGQYSQFEQQDAYLEDDIFDGIDLDALEAEAVEMSRARLATQATSGTGVVTEQPTKAGGSWNKSARGSYPWQ